MIAYGCGDIAYLETMIMKAICVIFVFAIVIEKGSKQAHFLDDGDRDVPQSCVDKWHSMKG